LKYKAKLRARVEADAASLKAQTVEAPQVATVSAESSDFVKTTLETAVSEGWTKTKTIEELRKSEERITIKKARELTKDAFDAKNAPVETPVKVAASSSDFVKTTLETAVSEGWTKTKTVEELRKSEERITIKKARDLVKEAFEAKSEPIAIKA
jgi:precorrin-6B methylase 1